MKEINNLFVRFIIGNVLLTASVCLLVLLFSFNQTIVAFGMALLILVGTASFCVMMAGLQKIQTIPFKDTIVLESIQNMTQRNPKEIGWITIYQTLDDAVISEMKAAQKYLSLTFTPTNFKVVDGSLKVHILEVSKAKAKTAGVEK